MLKMRILSAIEEFENSKENYQTKPTTALFSVLCEIEGRQERRFGCLTISRLKAGLIPRQIPKSKSRFRASSTNGLNSFLGAPTRPTPQLCLSWPVENLEVYSLLYCAGRFFV